MSEAEAKQAEDLNGDVVAAEDCCCGEGSGDADQETGTASDANVKEINLGAPKNGQKMLRLAVAGCSHGEMDKIYSTLASIERQRGYKFDLLICTGDYQSVRNYGDLHHMHVKPRFRQLQTFYKYYSGEKVAPILTVFIGGNHEASGYLCELPNGGWVAPNIYYLGFANVVRFAGLRIAGLSGIFNNREYQKGHFERPPFQNYGDVVGVYHVRSIDIWRLKQLRPADNDKLSNPIDIMISHDWPAGIADYGDTERLFNIKWHLRADHESGKLGNPATMQLLYDIRPKHWLSSHLHVAFTAEVPHKAFQGKRPEPTKFLSLDKPMPRRQFVEALSIPVADDADFSLSYDPEWLAILKNTDRFTIASSENTKFPMSTDARTDFRPTTEEVAAISELGDLHIPLNTFRQTAPPLKNITRDRMEEPSSAYYKNPQSTKFCEWLGIRDLNQLLVDLNPNDIAIPYYITANDGAPGDAAPQDANEFGDQDFIIDGVSGQKEEAFGLAAGDEEPQLKKLKVDGQEQAEAE